MVRAGERMEYRAAVKAALESPKRAAEARAAAQRDYEKKRKAAAHAAAAAQREYEKKVEAAKETAMELLVREGQAREALLRAQDLAAGMLPAVTVVPVPVRTAAAAPHRAQAVEVVDAFTS